MAPTSTGADEVARRLWAGAAGGASDPEEIAASAERLIGLLGTGLSRWIGGQGYRVLLDRALASVQAEHPALGGLRCLNGHKPANTVAQQPAGADEVAAGMVALVTALVELLEKIIGADMAIRLVEQTGKPSPRASASTQTGSGRDG